MELIYKIFLRSRNVYPRLRVVDNTCDVVVDPPDAVDPPVVVVVDRCVVVSTCVVVAAFGDGDAEVIILLTKMSEDFD